MGSSVWIRITFLVVCLAVLAGFPLLVGIVLSGDFGHVSLFTAASSILIALLGGAWLVYRSEKAIAHIQEATNKFAEGSFEEPIQLSLNLYPQPLMHGIREMANQLQGRIQALSQLSREQDAILRSMNEGVVTIDSEGRIKRVNEAARHLLGISKAYVAGHHVREIVHHIEVRSFMESAAASMIPTNSTITLGGEPEVIFDVYGSPLFQEDGLSSGTLIVLRDMTRVRKLENVRRDFVANVSHELRTPITSIKGFAETLLDGAMHEPDSLRKFLGIIAKHAERLHAIFNDLLTLSRLESGAGGGQIELSNHNIAEIIREAIEACAGNATNKGISLTSNVREEARVEINPSLMQQAFVNLIENAIKYSDSGAQVTVTCEREGEYVRCSVTDTGPGIEASHLPRLFERFYRVDQGRSRQMGGTGLGLAIVKHIVQVHGGRVEVQSKVGEGSTFSLLLRARSY